MSVLTRPTIPTQRTPQRDVPTSSRAAEPSGVKGHRTWLFIGAAAVVIAAGVGTTAYVVNDGDSTRAPASGDFVPENPRTSTQGGLIP